MRERMKIKPSRKPIKPSWASSAAKTPPRRIVRSGYEAERARLRRIAEDVFKKPGRAPDIDTDVETSTSDTDFTLFPPVNAQSEVRY